MRIATKTLQWVAVVLLLLVGGYGVAVLMLLFLGAKWIGW